MTLLSHFPVVGVSNIYLVGPDGGGDAVIVDPGIFDVALLRLVEEGGFNVGAVLATHSHENHVQGLRTLRKIYDADIYGSGDTLMGFPCKSLVDGEILDICGFETEVIAVGGHTTDSLVYRIGNFLFTGDVLSAGRIGTSTTSWGRSNLIDELKTKLLSLEDDLIILPGHGPPTSLDAERRLNPDLAG